MPIKNEENASHMTDSCVIESLADNFYMSYTQNELADSSKSFLSRKSQLSKLQNRGSPIDFNVAVDTSHVTVDVQKCKSVLINQMCSFTVDTKDNHGDIKVNITNPEGNHIPVKVTNSQNSWKADFNPTEIGEYYIDVFFANQLVNGSPFKCNVYDPTKIKIVPCLFGVVDQLAKFEVDASQAGTGQLEIAIENGRIPCNFTNQGNLRFVPAFTPREPGKHEITIKFNSYEVPGSPFVCNVVDMNKLTLIDYEQNGGVLLFPIHKLTSLELNSSDFSNSDITIKLTSPSGQQVPINRSVTPQNTLKISFQPKEIGTHLLEINVASVGISGSPFEVKIYDASRIVVSDMRGNEVNKQCELTIDASNAGEGQLEISVNEGTVKNNVKQIKAGQYAVSFLPTKQDNYVIDIQFNQEVVPGCPKKVFVRDSNSAKLSSTIPENVLLGTSSSFQVEGIHNIADFSARIIAPSEQEFVPKIIQVSQTECRIEWIPYELGTYLIQATYCDRLVKGTPFKIKTYDPKRVIVYNIKDGCAFKPNTFCVDAGQAGEGSLEIGISCNGQYIPNQVKPLGNSKFEVHFLPQEAAIHYANINFNNDPVKGSPFAIKVVDTNLVTAQGKGLGLIPINVPTSFQVFAGNAGGGQVRALVTGPKGENVTVKLYQQANGDSIGEFVPLSIGQYRIEILYANQPVVGSPFFANSYDPQALEIVNMPKDLIVGAENFLEVNLSKVGSVDFDIKVVTPSGNSLPVTYEGQAYKKIRIVPIELGLHRITLLLAGQQTNGMPISLNSIDSRLPAARGDGLHHALEDRQASFCVESQGMQGNLDVKIEGPQQYTKNQIERQSDGSYIVKYTPVEVGQFKIFVKWNNRDIPGSPFLSYVVNPEKVRIVGGWQSILDFRNILHLKLFEEKVINFETSEAGPGTLNASILSPNGTKLPLRLTSQGQMYSLIFTALYEGEYKIFLSWDNYQIPHTPIIAKTSPQSDASKIEISGNGLSEAKINQESDFVIDGSRAGEMSGVPEIRLTGTRCDIDVRVLQLGHSIYRCSYTPQIPGAYLLNIKWNNIQIGESPYKVNVVMNSDPAKVVVSGEGIKSGVYGQEIKALIDTRRAGPGELTAHCMGPNKVAFCEFFDHKDGTFTLYVKPQEPGKHLLQVKYNDDHVPGSPYVIRIAGPPDAGKVKVIGPGICHGVLNKFKSRFICETRGAGAGQLTVRIRGPKGAFRVEMQRETQKERTILCKYDPIEAGEYQINVKWSNQHVPGSPFNVHVFAHEDELEHFLRSNPDEAYAFQQQQLQYQQLNI